MIWFYYSKSSTYCHNHYTHVYLVSRPEQKILLLSFYFFFFPMYLLFLIIVGVFPYIVCFLIFYYTVVYCLYYNNLSLLNFIIKDVLYFTFSLRTIVLLMWVPKALQSDVILLIGLLFLFWYFLKNDFENFK